mmetsp:Transcript_11294/g.35907  ORF Transcript_11294/g.35907 Transcript_11294/m.35907 type:complete len:331 (+) Transcript_11294:2280-3272(+)
MLPFILHPNPAGGVVVKTHDGLHHADQGKDSKYADHRDFTEGVRVVASQDVGQDHHPRHASDKEEVAVHSRAICANTLGLNLIHDRELHAALPPATLRPDQGEAVQASADGHGERLQRARAQGPQAVQQGAALLEENPVVAEEVHLDAEEEQVRWNQACHSNPVSSVQEQGEACEAEPHLDKEEGPGPKAEHIWGYAACSSVSCREANPRAEWNLPRVALLPLVGHRRELGVAGQAGAIQRAPLPRLGHQVDKAPRPLGNLCVLRGFEGHRRVADAREARAPLPGLDRGLFAAAAEAFRRWVRPDCSCDAVGRAVIRGHDVEHGCCLSAA